MVRINLVYDDVFDDADILLVPEWVAEQAYYWPMRYGEWLISQGCHNMETDAFVEWLNQQIIHDDEKALILMQHVSVNPENPRIDF